MLNYRALEIAQVSQVSSRKSNKDKGVKVPSFLVDPSEPHTMVIREDELEKVIDCVSVFFDILYVNGLRRPCPGNRISSEQKSYNETIQRSKDRTINQWIGYVGKNGMDSWKNIFKYKITAFFSYAFNQDQPPLPAGLEKPEYSVLRCPYTIVCGYAGRWVWSRKVRDPTLFKNIALSFLQSKKGAPPVSEEAILSARKATWLQLTSKPGRVPTYAVKNNDLLNWEKDRVIPSTYIPMQSIQIDDKEVLLFRDLQKGLDWDDECREFKDFTILDKEWVCGQLRRTVNEIFGRKSLKSDEIYKPFFPSTSSNYIYSRREMGAVSALYEAYDGFGKQVSGIDFCLGQAKVSKRLPEEFGMRGLEEAQEIAEFEIEFGPEVKETLAVLYDDTVLQERWKQAYDHLFELALEERPLTKTIGLPEPLKVRVITCGPPLTYSVLKPLQRVLWKTLKKWDVFRLIGEPITADFLMKKIGRLEENEEYVSGDYKASTDYLHSWVSETLNQCIFENYKWNNRELNFSFLEKLEKLSERALTHHLIEDPENPETVEEQKEGQLMGSIVSFPFLCLANAALCRAALELANGKTYTLKEAPLACNGDDCILRGLKGRIRPMWELVCSLGGLHSSVGKTYFSTEFLVMNSVHYDVIKEADESHPETPFLVERKYVNMGLVYGKSKSGEANKAVYQLGTIHRALKRTCPPESFVAANRLFIQTHRSTLEKSGLPWFLPEWCGGLGLVRESDKVSNSEKWDLYVAGSIRRALNDPCSDQSLHPKQFRGIEEWLMHKHVMTEFKDNWAFTGLCPFENIEYEGTQRLQEQQWSDFYTSAVVDLLFTKKCEVPRFEFSDGTIGYGPYLEAEVHLDKLVAGERMLDINKWNLRHNQIMFKKHDAILRRDTSGYPFMKGNYPESYLELALEKRESYYPLFSIRK